MFFPVIVIISPQNVFTGNIPEMTGIFIKRSFLSYSEILPESSTDILLFESESALRTIAEIVVSVDAIT